jgi:hypothetical protein
MDRFWNTGPGSPYEDNKYLFESEDEGMIITNKLGLPKAFEEMAREEHLSVPKRYSATSLLKGIREAILEKRHANEIEQDVSDMIWLLFGKAVHSILENQQEEGHEIKETKLTVEFGEYTLSGIFDLYSEKEKKITDYKTCSVWKLIFGDFTDWKRQLLIYAYMMRKIGFEVNSGEIVALIKDHSKRDAKIKVEYPKLPVQVIKFDFTEEDFAGIEVWLSDSFHEIRRCENLSDDELPLCTPEERYNSGDKYAVMKTGRKTALRVLDTREEAEQWMKTGGGDYIDTRPGEDKKCLDYCAACEFCSHYKQIKAVSE